uniref:C3H1-type domain-containing protein n=2 Tax=Eukaryota TaxID=2759 RepID=T1L432_TETUR
MPSNSLSGLPSSPTNIFISSYTSNNNRSSSHSANSSRYKTELCRPYDENGVCKYGDKCQFAHGDKELRTLQRHPKYKTELCRTYHTTGFCPYGPRCHFIHQIQLTHLTF